MTLTEITKRKTEAEDRHGRVFATACTALLTTTGGGDLVTAWLATYREMELLRKMEAQIIGNGKFHPESRIPDPASASGPQTLSEKRTETRSDAPAPESAPVTVPKAADDF